MRTTAKAVNAPAGLPANLQGVFYALAATGLFSVAAAMAKLAAADYHVLQILFFRQLAVFLSTLPGVAGSLPGSLKTSRPGLHALRLGGAFVALSCGIWAVTVLPLTTATTLAFAQVFFTALLAALFLAEPVGPRRIAAILLGFLGVLIVLRPGLGGFAEPAALIPIAGACGAAVAIVSVRWLTRSESTATLLVYQASFVGLLAGVPLFWLWVTPDPAGLLLLTSMAVLATLGQWAGIKALRLGEASVIGNIEYTKLIYAAALGFLLFSEVPDRFTLLGAAIIVASAAVILHLGAPGRKTPGQRRHQSPNTD